MTKVTNNENMRRYVHMALSNQRGGGNTPSGDITIDDVVKFIHDDISQINPNIFPYTTWDSIPNYDDAENNEICKSSNDEDNFKTFILSTTSYTIGVKDGLI